MNIHAPKEAAEFYLAFEFVGKIHTFGGKQFMKVKQKEQLSNRKQYWFSFERFAIAHDWKDFDKL